MIKISMALVVTFFFQTTLVGQKPDLHLELKNGIEIKAKPAYPDEDISTYNFLEIFLTKKQIFKDTTLSEYTIEDSAYPIVYDFKTHLELLIEIDGRPNKNLIYKFFIKDQVVKKVDTIPTFLTTPKNLDQDDNLELAGCWEYGEVWGDPIEVTGYNPIVFYEITDKGILLDSLTTKRANIEVYGRFYGFHYNEQIEVPYVNSQLSKEIGRIVRGNENK